jgi:NAD(P)-dependent dehydrogenase (short-subunit alcohol dehydrogenase family)
MPPTVLVTGSTDGIGIETALSLGRQGARLVIHGRDEEKTADAAYRVSEETGADAEYFVADFSSQSEIRRFADKVSRIDRLDVLINNAGTFEPVRRVTPDGIEKTFAVNFIATFLLTHMLLPLLGRSAPSRVVNVASIAHWDTKEIDWDDLQGERHYDPYRQYSLSKFGVVAFTYQLAGRLSATGVTANCLHPGVIATKLLMRGFPGTRGLPPGEGAKTPVFLALSPDIAGVTGKYYDSGRPARSSPLTHDQAVCERIWKVAEQLCGL